MVSTDRIVTPEVYCLLDANLLAGCYASQTFNNNSKSAKEIIRNLVDSVRAGCSPHIKLLVPEICVAEAQTVLSKHANPQWKKTTKKNDPQSIHGTAYKTIANKMMVDLHGGKLIESIPLQRYHVLCKHLIGPVDHHTHKLSKDNKKHTNEMGGTDQLICGTAIWLTRFLGQTRLLVLTADYRMDYVLKRSQKMTDKQIESWGIKKKAEEDIGFPFSRAIYPKSLYLPQAKPSQLKKWFGAWPLPEKKPKGLRQNIQARQPTPEDIEKLVELYRNFGIGRDRLPYSMELSLLTKQFHDATGLGLGESEVWQRLILRLKRGGGTMRKHR